MTQVSVKSQVKDKKFASMLSEGIHKVGKTYEIPLPFKENNSKLTNNKTLATKQLNQLKVRLQRDKNLPKQLQRLHE